MEIACKVSSMSHYFIACALGAESGRVSLGHLQRDSLTVSEIHRFQNSPIVDGDSLQWDVPRLYGGGLHAF